MVGVMGVHKDCLGDGVGVLVANPHGYNQMKLILGDDCIGIHVLTNGKTRLLRYLMREEHPDVSEACRRYISDERDFADFEAEHQVVNESALEDAVETVKGIIESYIKKEEKAKTIGFDYTYHLPKRK